MSPTGGEAGTIGQTPLSLPCCVARSGMGSSALRFSASPLPPGLRIPTSVTSLRNPGAAAPSGTTGMGRNLWRNRDRRSPPERWSPAWVCRIHVPHPAQRHSPYLPCFSLGFHPKPCPQPAQRRTKGIIVFSPGPSPGNRTQPAQRHSTHPPPTPALPSKTSCKPAQRRAKNSARLPALVSAYIFINSA